MHIHCHSGISSTRLQETLPGYGTVWFDPKVLANILFLSNVKKKYRVTFVSRTNDIFYVHKLDGAPGNFLHFKMEGGYISWTQA
jgi:hypothetical protein